MFSVTSYKSIPSWDNAFPDKIVKLSFSSINTSWNSFFVDILNNTDINKIDKALSAQLEKSSKIYPYPSLIFNAFVYTNYTDLKCVIIGQDPYFNSKNGVPEAMGLSFSLPYGQPIPSSLNNIYKNMLKYKIITKMPSHGNLQFWAYQGVLLLNTSLTVTDNQQNGHSNIWAEFTNRIIEKISEESTNVIFVLWGSSASKKINIIDTTKHKVIISSHPSGLSCDKPLGVYPSFANNDHFGQINKYLKEVNKKPIVWGL